MEFLISHYKGSLVCEPESTEICLENSNSLVTRYIFKRGRQTGCVDTYSGGYLILQDNHWTFNAKLDSTFIFLPIKEIITRVVTLAEDDKYAVYLPNNYEDLPNVYALDVLQPAIETRKNGKPDYKKRKIECWFCMSSQHFDKSLVTHIYSHFYMTAAKGPMTNSHGLIIPIDHIALTALEDVILFELESLLRHISAAFREHGLTSIFWISKKKLTDDRLHDIIGFVGLEATQIQKLPNLQTSEFSVDFDRDHTECYVVEGKSCMTVKNPRFLDFVTHLFSVSNDWKNRTDNKKQQECIEFLTTIPPLY